MAFSDEYDKSDAKSIEAHASKILNKSLRQILGDSITQTYKGKGKFGQILEESYFGYRPNNISEPDFPEAGVELKTAPLKETSKGLVSKERLVFNNINYKTEHETTFATSSFWKKNSRMLLMFYLHQKGCEDMDFVFKIVRMWRFPAADLKIIKDDWELIVNKIRAGLAHEISEGDTMYLGACTKGANKESVTEQPFSETKAMRRAFSLKSKYLNFIIRKSLANEQISIDDDAYHLILNEGKTTEKPKSAAYRKPPVIGDSEPVVKTVDEYAPGETFEDLVLKKFVPHYGLSAEELENRFGLPHSKAKSRFHIIAKAILGVSKAKIEEFEKADIGLKTVRLEHNGTLKESMSFAQIRFNEIIHESWEESYWFNTLTKRFFFVVFQKDGEGELRLKKVMFWTMPAKDLEVARLFWEDTKRKIEQDDYRHFIKISDGMICHVRPKGTDSRDLMETPSGRMEKKKCYWLNASYIKKLIE